MKSLELALAAAPTLFLLAFVTVSASPQELEDYVDKEAISEAAEDFKGKVHQTVEWFRERVFLMPCHLPS